MVLTVSRIFVPLLLNAKHQTLCIQLEIEKFRKTGTNRFFKESFET